MSDPEIARRCLQCGATVRTRAGFCPQCGALMASVREGGRAAAKTNSAGREVRPGTSVRVASDARSKAEEADRLSRVREGSRVVLDEAAHDPSLRFVLVAFLLFAVCLALLVANLLSR